MAGIHFQLIVIRVNQRIPVENFQVETSRLGPQGNADHCALSHQTPFSSVGGVVRISISQDVDIFTHGRKPQPHDFASSTVKDNM